MTGHEIYWEQQLFNNVRYYDPTDDGPEVNIIRREQENQFIDWFEDLPNRLRKAWKIARRFAQAHS